MFMPLIKQYVKDEKKAAFLNAEFKNDLGFFARWMFKMQTGTKLDMLRAMIVSAAFSKDPAEALKPIIEQLEMRKK
ncbi:TPA: hypothetical protein RXL02_001061 [Escherichia coli]|nr:hypothetical protein [Escherichia coli]HEA7605258.1 hypothetical protein [Escherichia coli]